MRPNWKIPKKSFRLIRPSAVEFMGTLAMKASARNQAHQ